MLVLINQPSKTSHMMCWCCAYAVALMNLCDTIRGKVGVDYDVALKKFAK